eukprot:SAG22_NODE_171_length_16646_cov_6.580528_5_plen_111_part_00
MPANQQICEEEEDHTNLYVASKAYEHKECKCARLRLCGSAGFWGGRPKAGGRRRGGADEAAAAAAAEETSKVRFVSLDDALSNAQLLLPHAAAAAGAHDRQEEAAAKDEV